MLKRILSSTVVFIMLFHMYAWADTADIAIKGDNAYKAIRLTPEIYNSSNTNLSDILLLDENGEAVPYFINSFEAIEREQEEAEYPLVFMDSFVKDGHTYADYYIEGSEERDVLATSVTARTQTAAFAKNVELRGGYDGVNWDFIKNDMLYRVNENEKLEITFEQPLKYTHYRFKILDNAEKISFDGVYLGYSESDLSKEFFTETLIPEFEAEEDGKTTIVKVFGLKNVRLSQLTIETGNQFKRPVHYADGRTKSLYHLSFDNTVYQDTSLAYDGYRENGEVLELRIDNGDDTPIEIDKVTAVYYVDELVFKGENDRVYTLFFNDSTALKPPVYDIVNYKDLILREGWDVLTVGSIMAAEAIEEPEKPDYTTLFNIVVVIVSLLLGFIILIRLKKSHSA